MEKLERYRGHLYNWYDTRTLASRCAALRVERGQRQPGRQLLATAAGRPAGTETQPVVSPRLAGTAGHPGHGERCPPPAAAAGETAAAGPPRTLRTAALTLLEELGRDDRSAARCPPTATTDRNGGGARSRGSAAPLRDDLARLVPIRVDLAAACRRCAELAACGGRGRARGWRRAHPPDRPPRPALPREQAAMDFEFLYDPAATCWRSAMTSASGAAIRRTTTCSPRRRGWPVSSSSPRIGCRRSTGLPWAGS
jgi:cyclic beta-1,2-glucan synthetase